MRVSAGIRSVRLSVLVGSLGRLGANVNRSLTAESSCGGRSVASGGLSKETWPSMIGSNCALKNWNG